MHDIDRTALETWGNGNEMEADEYESQYQYSFEGPFNEVEEMELASQLLEVTDEAELDQFLGDLFKKASRAVGGFIRGPIGRQLGGMLKGLAKKALPIAGGALGSFVPGIGTAIGTAAGGAAANLFELELEGMSAEDQEFEIARHYVRLAGEAAQQAAQAPQNEAPQEAAKQALITAAQQHAPGLLAQAGQQGTSYGQQGAYGQQGSQAQPGRSGQPGPAGQRRPRSGRWVRNGRTIVILGA
jgi:hypothetical protein